jgi:hypothetical protein
MRAAARRWLQCLADPGGAHWAAAAARSRQVAEQRGVHSGGRFSQTLDAPRAHMQRACPHAAACGGHTSREPPASVPEVSDSIPDCRVRSANCPTGRAAAAARRDMTCSCARHIVGPRPLDDGGENGETVRNHAPLFLCFRRNLAVAGWTGRPSDQRKHQRRVTGQGNQGRGQRWCAVEANTAASVSSQAVPPTHCYPPSEHTELGLNRRV